MMVTIIGAGLAGLACARRLTDNKIDVRLIEKSETVGGRVRSRFVDGFCVDRGFQVLLNTYPALKQFPELSALSLYAYPPGARILQGHRVHTLSDPFRNPADALPSVITPVVSIQDKLLMWQLAAELNRRPLDSLWDEPDQSTLRFLRRRGFSTGAIELFFRPFIGGITLDESLGTSATIFKFVWSMLSNGLATSPAGGMQAIPDAMEDVLLAQNVSLLKGIAVNEIRQDGSKWIVQTATETYHSEIVVVATDVWTLPTLVVGADSPKFRTQRALWISLDRRVDCGPSLILNPDLQSPILTIAPMHVVAPDRAPSGKSLFAVTIRHDHIETPTDEILSHFHEVLQRAKLLSGADRVRCIDDQLVTRAQFVQNPGHFQRKQPPNQLGQGLFVCGEHLDTSSINGALNSGVGIADEISRILSCRE